MDHRSKPSARSRLVSTLADEILQQPSESCFAIASEHQLCRRFSVSRVTVRLALGDLEAKGLIFRRHGKGTFAYGRLNRVRRSVGVLLKTLPTTEQWPISEMIRGFHAGAAALRTNVLLIHASPEEWSSEMRRDLGAVLLFPTGLARTEIDFLEHIKMPALFAWDTNHSGCHIEFGQQAMARIVTERMLMGGHERLALVSGFEKSLDALKRSGVLDALDSVGMAPQKLAEYSICGDGGNLEEVVSNLVCNNTRSTAVIATDDSIAVRLIKYLHERTAFRVPQDLSIASFNRPPFLSFHDSDLSTVDFDFFKAGQLAAEALSRASLTGGKLENIVLPGKVIEGSTVCQNRFQGRKRTIS